MKKLSLIAILASFLFVQGCVHKVVTVPVKIAYKTTKGVVKGTAAVARAVIPDGDDDEEKDKSRK
ncbi:MULTISPECIES: NF038104 family lipoprotein [Psychrobacter]|uniref:NF038104 family lipoprotein n=1 Tax=Psychrobacter TaxID=497 RepID=UPI00146F9029|nr:MULTISPECIES: NF038104 family lipoprotein [Psychrobacter]